MKTFVTLVIVPALTVALATAAEKADKAGPNDNKPPEGFTALFNGKDLTNWQGAIGLPKRNKMTPDERAEAQKKANEKILPNWKVENGILYYDGKTNSLQSAKDFGNFELYLDWKIEKKGDSGLYLRGNPQVQIWDSDNAASGEDKGSGSGGLWNNTITRKGKMPLKKADNPVGEWNTFHITMIGDLVTVVLNGEKVVDNAALENYWEKGKPLPARGPIELQHHGDKLWFKNIYIKELPD